MDAMENAIEACRTCGTYFFTTSNLLRHLFAATADSDLVLIHTQLKAWDVQINESDGYPQTICTSCILEFQKIFKFRRICIETQENLRFLDNIREKNIQVKTELPDPDEDKFCGFIYVDDISDDEGNAPVTPFDFSHVPIKVEDRSEEATVPTEIPYTMAQSYNKMHDAVIPGLPDTVKTAESYKEINGTEMEDKKPDIKLLEAATRATLSTGIKCTLCTYNAANQIELNKHIKLAHEIKDYECHICGKKFKNSTAMRLKYHIKWHKLSRHIKCAQCGFYCASKHLLNEHKRAVHAKLPCEICNKQFTAKKLKMHMREHEITDEHICAYCDAAFETPAEQEQHMWSSHRLEVESYNDMTTAYTIFCAQCDQAFKTTTELQYHVQEDHNFESAPAQISFDKLQESTASLNISNQNYGFQDYQNIHNIVPENTNEVDDSDPNISANFIDGQDTESESSSDVNSKEINSMDDSDDLMVNKSMHQYSCAQCPRTFKSVDKLLEHHTEHTKQRTEFKCTICHKTFKLMVQLNRHLKSHTKAPL